MEAWIDQLAEALGEDTLSPQETAELLEAAREVAHRIERRITPLSAFLLGQAVGEPGRRRVPGRRRHGRVGHGSLAPSGRAAGLPLNQPGRRSPAGRVAARGRRE